MKRIITLTAIILIVLGNANAQNGTGQEVVQSTNVKMLCTLTHTDPQHHFVFSSKVFLMSNNTWGYNVFADGKLLFHQAEMPGKIQGIGFASKEDAAKVAAYIIKLLESPVVAPIATIADITRIGVL
ncbi:MAG: DUF4907 domain-containing protein [Chitinophagaceae bacterium]|nr:DUF4907 domain-containing protein [Chitinophagaceae bacterium]